MSPKYKKGRMFRIFISLIFFMFILSVLIAVVETFVLPKVARRYKNLKRAEDEIQRGIDGLESRNIK